MEPSTKKAKVEEPPASPSHAESPFVKLNDDCIDAIFEYLPPEDLCSMSFTCERMRGVAHEHFCRKYAAKFPNVVVDLNRVSEDERISHHLNYDENYLKYFLPCVPITRIECENIQLKDLIRFINAECDNISNLTEIHFGGHSLSVDKENEFNHELNSIENVSIYKYGGGDIYNGLLKFCPNLKSLAIATDGEGNTNWMLQTYPNLKSLSIRFDDKFHRTVFEELAEQFFQRNPQVKDVTCSIISTMKVLLQKVPNIERLTMKFGYFHNMNNIINDLQSYCVHNRVQWLALEMKKYHDAELLTGLNSHQPVRDLKLFCERYFTINAHLRRLQSLNKLSLWFDVGDECPDRLYEAIEASSNSFNNLESFEMMIIQQNAEISFEEFRRRNGFNMEESDNRLRRRDLVRMGARMNRHHFEDFHRRNRYSRAISRFEEYKERQRIEFKRLLDPFVQHRNKITKLLFKIRSNKQLICFVNDLTDLNADRLSLWADAPPLDITVVFSKDYGGPVPKFIKPNAENCKIHLTVYRSLKILSE